MDDGAQNPKEMHAMLRKAAEDGIGRIVATPHVTPGVRRFNREQYQRSLEEARSYCQEKDLDIALYEGAEILYTGQTCDFLMEGRVPTMAGTDHVLVEFSPDVRYDRLCDALDALQCHGYLPIIAHVERYPALRRASVRRRLEGMTLLMQSNAESFLSRRSAHRMLKWWKQGSIHILASDCHHADHRPPELGALVSLMERRGQIQSLNRAFDLAHRILGNADALNPV